MKYHYRNLMNILGIFVCITFISVYTKKVEIYNKNAFTEQSSLIKLLQGIFLGNFISFFCNTNKYWSIKGITSYFYGLFGKNVECYLKYWISMQLVESKHIAFIVYVVSVSFEIIKLSLVLFSNIFSSWHFHRTWLDILYYWSIRQLFTSCEHPHAYTNISNLQRINEETSREKKKLIFKRREEKRYIHWISCYNFWINKIHENMVFNV